MLLSLSYPRRSPTPFTVALPLPQIQLRRRAGARRIRVIVVGQAGLATSRVRDIDSGTVVRNPSQGIGLLGQFDNVESLDLGNEIRERLGGRAR